jgi:hypothetical protein
MTDAMDGRSSRSAGERGTLLRLREIEGTRGDGSLASLFREGNDAILALVEVSWTRWSGCHGVEDVL